MIVYLDVSCLNRPFDDQSQTRIRLESEAVTLVLQECDEGSWTQVSSDIANIEIDAIPDDERRGRVRKLLPKQASVLKLSQDVHDRAVELQKLGIKPADALHVASAETLDADVCLSCDDRLCRAAHRHRRELKVRVANPLDWLKEIAGGRNT